MLNEDVRIEAYVGSYTAEAAGFTVNTAIVLPMEPGELKEKIEAFNRAASKICEEMCDEVFIADWHYRYPHGKDAADCAMRACEYGGLETANLIAMELQTMDDETLDRCGAALKGLDAVSLSGREVLALCYNLEDVPCWSLEDGFRITAGIGEGKSLDNFSEEEMLGYTILQTEKPELVASLEEAGLDDLFDFESYGRDEAINRGMDIVDGYVIENFDFAKIANAVPADELEKDVAEDYAYEKKLSALSGEQAGKKTGGRSGSAPERGIARDDEIGETRGAR